MSVGGSGVWMRVTLGESGDVDEVTRGLSGVSGREVG